MKELTQYIHYIHPPTGEYFLEIPFSRATKAINFHENYKDRGTLWEIEIWIKSQKLDKLQDALKSATDGRELLAASKSIYYLEQRLIENILHKLKIDRERHDEAKILIVTGKEIKLNIFFSPKLIPMDIEEQLREKSKSVI